MSTQSMWLPWIAVIVGFIFLMWSADRFVMGSAATARNYGIAPLIIGMTIMGFGTSAPEIFVAAIASWDNNTGLAIGNAIGSNIANIGLVLGAAALVTPMKVNSETLKREFPILLIIMFVDLMLIMDGTLGRFDGLILLVSLITMIMWMIHLGTKSRITDPLQNEFDVEVPKEIPTKKAIIWVIIGLVVLLVSSRVLVWGAVSIAKSFGISDLLVGLTIVAVGTSLPELAASVIGALKGEHEMVLGNVIGSNMFNLLGVMSVPGLIRPGAFDVDVLNRDYPIMISLTIVLFIMAYGFRGPGTINRIEGACLIAAFFSYMGYLYFSGLQ